VMRYLLHPLGRPPAADCVGHGPTYVQEAEAALTWRPGQWHPTSGPQRVLGATDLGFVRSVLDLEDYPLSDRAPV
jgi:hypothetical protein